MKKLLVSGAGGFVGARIMTQLAGRYELCAFPKGMPATADEQTVADWVRREQPDVIVHTAALSDTGYSESTRTSPTAPTFCCRAGWRLQRKKRRKAGCVQL